MSKKFRVVVVVVGGLLHFKVYLSPLRGETSRTKSTRQVLDMFLDIFLDIERRLGEERDCDNILSSDWSIIQRLFTSQGPAEELVST